MPEISRRSFMELATGLLTSLPVLAGGLVLAPRQAHAEDDYTLQDQLAGKKSEYVIIDVVAPWEVGVMAVDITKGEERDGGLMYYPPVAGAHVTVASRFNGKTAEGTTNENGVANIDVRELAVHEDGQDVNNLDDYYFNGSITVTRDGYREFRTALVVVQGGGGLQVPFHPLDADGPYPYQASFDDWDALYTKNEFPMTPKNVEKHTIGAQMYGLPEAGEVTFELWVKGEKAARKRMQTTAGEKVQVGTRAEKVYVRTEMRRQIVDYNFATGEPYYADIPYDVYEDRSTPVYGRPASANFEGLFLQEGHKDQVPEGAQLQLVVKQKGHDPWVVSLGATAEKCVGDEPAEDNSGKELSLINASNGSMGTNGLMSTGQKWPNIIPILGGGGLNFWSPTLPVNVSATPTGFVQITADIPIWGYRNDKGNDEPHGWGHYSRQSVQKQFDKKYDTMTKMAKKAQSLAGSPGKIKQLDLFKSVSFDINFQLIALGKWNKKKGLFQGEAAAQLVAGLDFTLTENFMAGPVPVLITFALDATLTFALQAATYVNMEKNELPIKAATDFSRWHFDFENTGFTMTFNITPTLSVGVGVRGVASVSIKGSITLTLFFCVPMGTQPKGLPSPHFAAGWSAQVSLVIELFLFTFNFTLFEQPFNNFYDNWNGKNVVTQAESVPLRTLADKSLSELLNTLMPITDDMLKKTMEATVSSSLSTQASEEGEAWPISYAFENATVAEVTDEHTGNTHLVYAWATNKVAPVKRLTEADLAELEKAAAQEAPKADAPTAESLAATVLSQKETIDPTGAKATEGASASTDVVTGSQRDVATPDERGNADEPLAEPAPAPEGSLQTQAEELPAENSPTATAPEASFLATMADVDTTALGVASLGVAGGVRPSQDTRLFGTDDKHVFGATRAKVISFGVNKKTNENGGVWLFRLASVEVAGAMRTRIIGNCIDGPRKGTSRLVEFDTSAAGVSHDELYDYDFDVVGGYECLESANNWGSTRSCFYLQFAVVSGRRQNPTSPTLAASATDLVFSNVLFLDALSITYNSNQPSYLQEPFQEFKKVADAALAYYSGHGFFDASQMPLTVSGMGNNVVGKDVGKSHSIASVQLERCIADGSWCLDPYAFVVTFLDRCSDTEEGTLGDSADVRLGTILFNWVLNGTPGPSMKTLSVDGVGDGTAYEQTLSLYHHDTHTIPLGGNSFGTDEVFYFIVMVRGANKAHYRSMFVVQSTYSGDHSHTAGAGDYDPSIRLVPCRAQGYYLASYPTDKAQLDLPADQRDYSSWTLHKVTVSNTSYDDPWNYSASLEFTPIGPSGFNVMSFAVNPAGTFLFWPHSRDVDEDRVWDTSGKEDVQKRPAVYQIMACRLRGDRFGDPFVLADLPNDTDALVVAGTNSQAVAEMLRTVYEDTGEKTSTGKPLYHAADIYYTALPAVRCVTATACEAPRPFVSPGGKINFQVAVRNDGNTYLSGCKLQLCVHNKDKDTYEALAGASATITFGKDTIVESVYNQDDGKGGLTGLEDDYALAPGKTSVYTVTVTVPADLPTGDKKVLFVASDGVLVKGLYTQDEGDDPEANAVEFHVEPGDYNVVQVRTHADQPAFQRHMDFIGVSQAQAGGKYYQATLTGGGEGDYPSGSPSGSSRATLPETGDEGAGPNLGLAGAGLAALSAAVATYEHRRAENEQL
ncbi:MAG: hypothetical protein J6D54_12875 [Olsenella sp.]|nr:hypothetical protein [Olsenella sp.]